MLSLKGKKKMQKDCVSCPIDFFPPKGIDAFATAGLSLKVDLKIVWNSTVHFNEIRALFLIPSSYKDMLLNKL